MAVGETSGQAKPRKVVSSAAARERVADARGRRPTAETEAEVEPAPLIKEADPEFEKLLDEEEAIERIHP